MAIPRNVQFFLDMLTTRTRMIFGSLCPMIELVEADMTGKTVVITGGNAGLGFEMASKLASMNATVVLACRNRQRAEAAQQKIIDQQAQMHTKTNAHVHTHSHQHTHARVQIQLVDLASLQSVKDFATRWSGGKIDILINNAGLAYVSKEEEYTVDGLEALYQINFLSSFLLTKLLEPHLSTDARVIFNSSVAAYSGFIGDHFALEKVAHKTEPGFHTTTASSAVSQRYFTNKLMQAAFAIALQQRFDRDPLDQRIALSFDPSIVATRFLEDVKLSFAEDAPYVITKWLTKTTGISHEQGGATGVYLSTTKDASVTEHNKGGFWSANVHRLTPADFYSQEKLDKLWMRWSADADITWT